MACKVSKGRGRRYSFNDMPHAMGGQREKQGVTLDPQSNSPCMLLNARLQQEGFSYPGGSATAVTTNGSSSRSSSLSAWQSPHDEGGTGQEDTSSQRQLIPHRNMIELPQPTPNELAEQQKVVEAVSKVPDIINNVTAGIQRIDDALQKLDFTQNLDGTLKFFRQVASTVSAVYEPLEVLEPIFSSIAHAVEVFE